MRVVAIAGAALVAVIFIAANAHLLAVALRSEPDCAVRAGAMPAKRVC